MLRATQRIVDAGLKQDVFAKGPKKLLLHFGVDSVKASEVRSGLCIVYDE
jgi:hypothetical protein